ncbi:tetratricopeptide repeat protein [Prosthecobacter sp.]|uniref:tetratricopeptide repeat protein n=1 Tax=Prosthecobacter sp. TaxID=1965333 RepID=UPI003782E604
MSTGVIVLIIGGVLVLFVGILAALAIPVYNRVQGLAQGKKNSLEHKAPPPPAKALTEGQKQKLKEFGERIAEALTAADGEAIKGMLDSEGMADRVFDDRTSGFPQVSEMRKGFIAGATSQPGGWLRNVMGHKTRALHYRERDGYPAIVLRLMPEGGGVNYVDIVVRPHGETFRAVDMFTYMYASYFSDETRNLMATMMPSSSVGKLAAIMGATNFDSEILSLLKKGGECIKTGKYAEALAICDGLPEKYRTHRMFFMLRMQALMQLNGGDDGKYDAPYRQMLISAPDILGADSTTDLLMIDLLFLDNRLPEADACIQRVEKVVGGDPYLKVLRANTRRMLKDYPGALKLATEAQEEEPDLVDAVDTRLAVHLEQKHYPAILEEFRALKKKGILMTRKVLAGEDTYAEFLASPEFAAWEKELEQP